MNMILSVPAYSIWAEAKHAHLPDVAAVQKTVEIMSPADLQATLSRAETIATYGNVVTEAIRERKRRETLFLCIVQPEGTFESAAIQTVTSVSIELCGS
jgi:hypothetical protein